MRLTDTVQKRNIVLIGMPASGKSTVGVILAKILGKDFIDSDIVIQKREGAALSEIIESEDMFAARSELYERYADITVKEEGASVEDTVNAVVETLRRFRK